MCLIGLALNAHPRWALVLAASWVVGVLYWRDSRSATLATLAGPVTLVASGTSTGNDFLDTNVGSISGQVGDGLFTITIPASTVARTIRFKGEDKVLTLQDCDSGGVATGVNSRSW